MQNIKFLDTLFSRVDKFDRRLQGKKLIIYSNIIGSMLFIAFSVSMLILTPSQIKVTETGVINAQTFPKLLLGTILCLSAILLVTECIKLILRKPCAQIELELLAGFKSLIILCLFILYFVLLKPLGFIASSCIFSVLMMLYFRVKKPYYYLIGIAAGIFIGVLFQYVLHVRLP